MSFKNLLSTLICLALPTGVKPALLNLLGHRVSKKAKIGFSLIWGTRLFLGENATIGAFNLIKMRRLFMRPNSEIGAMNRITGKHSVLLKIHARIGHRNNITSGDGEGIGRPSVLCVGVWGQVTAGHRLDISESIIIGNDTVIAGVGSQFWTHGFVHGSHVSERAEVRGPIKIGNHVYIGSMSCFNPGVTIGDHVAVGALSSTAKSLISPGVYVSQPLRHIELNAAQRLANLPRVDSVTGKGFYYRGGDGLGKILAREAAARRASRKNDPDLKAG